MNLSKSFVKSPYNADKNIMMDILLTLLVIMIAGAYYFGYRAIMVTLVCVVFAIISELALKYFVKKEELTYDFNTVIYAVILSFFMPANSPLWVVVIGGVLLVTVRWLLEEKARYCFTNAALATAGVLNLAFFVFLKNQPHPFSKLQLISAEASSVVESPRTFLNLLIGRAPGAIGTTCLVAILLCGAYLAWRKIISWETPLCYVVVCAVLGALLWRGYNGLFIEGMAFAAVYGMSDFCEDKRDLYSKLTYGAGCGILTVLVWYITGFVGSACLGIAVVDTALYLWYEFSPSILEKLKK